MNRFEKVTERVDTLVEFLQSHPQIEQEASDEYCLSCKYRKNQTGGKCQLLECNVSVRQSLMAYLLAEADSE